MSKEVLAQYLGLESENEKQMLQFILQSAPLLKGVKMSCILMIRDTYLNTIREELQGTEIEVYVLDQLQGKCTILLYRRKLLELCLSQNNIRVFLEQYGYQKVKDDKTLCLVETLSMLGKRVAYFNRKEGIFPHEIGVFLGYPLEDVTGFIKNAGRNYLLNGYWKVYSDVRLAKRRFQVYDRAISLAVKEMFEGKPIREITGQK